MSDTPNVRCASLDSIGYLNYLMGEDGSVWTRYVRSCYTDKLGDWRQIRTTDDTGGRMLVNLTHPNGNRKIFTVSRLMLIAFVGPCPEGMECCHYDGNYRNNRLENLRWDTPSENSRDKIRHGTHNRGARCYIAKLTEEQVREIRTKYASGQYSMSMLGRMYGVALGTIFPIIHRRTWVYTD